MRLLPGCQRYVPLTLRAGNGYARLSWRILRPSPRAKGATMASSPGGTSPSLRLRRGLPADAEACGRICYDAFRAIAERHGFPPDFPSPPTR